MNKFNCKVLLFQILLSLFLSYFCQSLFAQSFQPCVVKEYNEELAKTPLEGVEVYAKDAGQRVSDVEGKLTLRFLTKNIGDHVEVVEISKFGYEIFNKDAIAQWIISGESRPFQIVLCKSDRFMRIKDNYNRISSENYAKQKRKEEERLEKERQKGLLKEEEYKRKLQELQDEFDKQLVSVRPYIDHFARIDLSELSNQERNIVNLVKVGQVDSAICLYNQMHLEEQFKDNRNTYFKLNEATEMLEQEKRKSNEQRDAIILQIWNKNDLLMMKGGKENIELVEKSYKNIANQDTTYLYGLNAYIAFLFGQGRYRENLRYLYLAAKCGEREYQNDLSNMYHNIANAYSSLDENDSAKVYLSKSLEANEKYNKNDSVEYLNNLLNYYISIAQIYDEEGNPQDAEIASEKALEYAQRLYNNDKHINPSSLRMALMFAIGYNQNKPSSVIEAWNKQYHELLNSPEIVEEGDVTIEKYFAILSIVNHLISQGKTDIAKYQLKEVIKRIASLYDNNQEKYRNLLSTFNFFLGSICYSEKDFSSAQKYLEKGCQLFELEYYTNKNAQTMETIVMGLKMLGDIKSQYGYCDIADSLYESALMGCDFMHQKEYVKSNYLKSILLYDKAMNFIQCEKIDLAIKTLENKIRRDSFFQQCLPDSCSPPNDYDGRYELAKLYNKKGQYNDAKLVVVPCIEVICNQIYEVNLLYVGSLVRTMEYKKAIQTIDNFEKRLSIWKDLSLDAEWSKEFDRFEQNENIMNLLLHYKAICFYAIGKEKKAKKLWNNVRKQLPEDIYYDSPLRNVFD